jgi:hypothetical protein
MPSAGPVIALAVAPGLASGYGVQIVRIVTRDRSSPPVDNNVRVQAERRNRKMFNGNGGQSRLQQFLMIAVAIPVLAYLVIALMQGHAPAPPAS